MKKHCQGKTKDTYVKLQIVLKEEGNNSRDEYHHFSI